MSTDLNALLVFVKVVQTGSFTAAALALNMPKSTVSQRVSELEERLGARLLQRTTRKLSLTDQGRVYYDRCARILVDLDEADRAVTNLQEKPRGLLRITVPTSAEFLGPIFTSFMQRCDGVQLEVLYTDRIVNLVEESFDVAFRAGALSDSTLMARPLGTFQFLLVASPRYLTRRGRPRVPQDLTKQAALVFNVGPQPRLWRLSQDSEVREVPVTPTLAVNDLDLLHDAVVGGVGIAMLPAYRCLDDLAAKRLERVLPDWDVPAEPVHALYPSGRHLSSKVKAMLDHLQKMAPPWVSGQGARRARERSGSERSWSKRSN
ncbi:MAG: LysR family transcriptional regulator [Proteobacteria bacterium]|nr:MAG: LysR family transcriptional regulator [Pseudomonadota bacterium]